MLYGAQKQQWISENIVFSSVSTGTFLLLGNNFATSIIKWLGLAS